MNSGYGYGSSDSYTSSGYGYGSSDSYTSSGYGYGSSDSYASSGYGYGSSDSYVSSGYGYGSSDSYASSGYGYGSSDSFASSGYGYGSDDSGWSGGSSGWSGGSSGWSGGSSGWSGGSSGWSGGSSGWSGGSSGWSGGSSGWSGGSSGWSGGSSGWSGGSSGWSGGSSGWSGGSSGLSGGPEDDVFSELRLLDAEIDGRSISLFFDAELDDSIPTSSRLKIKSGRKKCKIESITSTPSEGRLDILLKKPVKSGDSVSLTYRDLKKDQSFGVVQSTNGVDLSSINNFDVDNITEELVLPSIVDAYLDEGSIRLEFDSFVNGDSLKLKYFKIKVGRKRYKAIGAKVDLNDNTAVIITIKNNAFSDVHAMTLSYRDPTGDQSKGVLEDVFGNDISTFNDLKVDSIEDSSPDGQDDLGNSDKITGNDQTSQKNNFTSRVKDPIINGHCPWFEKLYLAEWSLTKLFYEKGPFEEQNGDEQMTNVGLQLGKSENEIREERIQRLAARVEESAASRGGPYYDCEFGTQFQAETEVSSLIMGYSNFFDRSKLENMVEKIGFDTSSFIL